MRENRNRNSALLWLPRIEAAGLPTPRTIIVSYSHRDCMAIFDGAEECPEMDRLIAAITEAGERIGWPCFLRTDEGSAKHDGPLAYKATGQDRTVGQCIVKTLEHHELTHMVGPDPKAFLVREFLELDAGFTCFGGLPIAREWRLFSDGEKVLCKHGYWPEDALRFYQGDAQPDNWRDILRDHHAEPAEMPELERMAVVAARVQGFDCKPEESWSVDFARDKSGKWWLIDMATMDDSWHWPGCPNGPLEAI